MASVTQVRYTPEDLLLINGSQVSYQVFPGHPNRVRIPEVAFTRQERLDPEGPAEGHGRIAPYLVVEVVSPNDTAYDIEAKFQDSPDVVGLSGFELRSSPRVGQTES